MKAFALVLVVLAAATAGAADAKQPLVYKTAAQAQDYVKNGLQRISYPFTSNGQQRIVNIKVGLTQLKSAVCRPGDVSKFEQARRLHYAAKRNAAGATIFHSFACSLRAFNRTFDLYVVPLAGNRWQVLPDK